MTFEKFATRIRSDILRIMEEKEGNTFTANVSKVNKLQGQTYTGLLVGNEGSAFSCVYDLDKGFRMLENGVDYEQIVDKAVHELTTSLKDFPAVPVDMLDNYDALKEHLTVQLISKSNNEDALSGVPYTEVAEDLVLVARAKYPAEELNGTFLINSSYISNLGVDPQTLIRDALENTKEQNPLKLKPLCQMMREEFDSGFPQSDDSDIWVASNTDMIMGASAIFYPGAKERVSEVMGGNYYIIPSSIHEVLLCREGVVQDWKDLEMILNDVNDSVVNDCDILSKKLYHYDSESGLIETAETYELKKIA